MRIIGYMWALLAPLQAVAMTAHQHIITQNELAAAYAGSLNNRIQINVPNQFSMPASSTDCGYHAFYNGLTIADLAHASEDELEECLFRVGATDLAVQKRIEAFGDSATDWRSKVVQIRADEKAARPILDALTKAIDPTNLTGEEFEALMKIIGPVASKVKEPARQHYQGFIEYHITPDLAYELLAAEIQDKLESKISDEAKKTYEALKDKRFDSYFKIKELKYTVDNDPATWLYADEMKPLAYDESTEQLFKTRLGDTNFFILGDSLPLNQPLANDPAVMDSKEFKQLQSTMQDRESNVLAVILLYTKEPSFDLFSWMPAMPSWLSGSTAAQEVASATSSSSKGHWITLVVNKVGPQTQFITADSGGNQSRLDDKRVNEVITLLTGKQASAQAKGLPQSQKASPRSARNAWLRWQKTTKFMVGASVMALACLAIARKINKDGRRADQKKVPTKPD